MDLGEAYLKVTITINAPPPPLLTAFSRRRNSGLNLWRLQLKPRIAPILSLRSRCRARTLQRLRNFCSLQAIECVCVVCLCVCVFFMFVC